MLIKEIVASLLLSCYLDELVIFQGTIRGVSAHFLSYTQRKERERESELSGRLKQSHSSSS